MKELLKKDWSQWSRDELLSGIAMVKQRLDAMQLGDLADMRVGLTEADPDATGRVLDHSFGQRIRLMDFQRTIERELERRPIPIIEHPRDAGDWLIYHKNHGWMQGRFAAGEHACWWLGGDLFEALVEQDWDPILRDHILYDDGPVTHFLPLPLTPMGGA